jgi:prolyl oligopeptidase
MLFHRIVRICLFAGISLATAVATPLSYPVAAPGNVGADYDGVQVPAPSGRDATAQRLQQIWNFERWSAPERHGRYWFYTHNDGLQNQEVIFATPDPKTPGRVLLDPNTL